MGKIVVVVESPAKCKKIEGFLGPGYKCVASFGHIRGIKDGLKGIAIENDFTPSFKLLSEKSKYIVNLRRVLRGASEVILATDDDREGEAIAWHICQVFNLPIASTKRIIFHEITSAAIKNAVAVPTRLDMDKVHAQQARQVLDLLVGFRLSPMLWRHISYSTKNVLSAGRCQTPALRLIYDNQKDINKSPGKKKYDTTGTFTEKELDFALNYNYEDKDKMEEFLEESVNYDHVYKCSVPKKTTKKQPKPFTTSTLQQKASNELHFSPKQTMRSAQKLYEGGYITYMRTDSKTYSAVFLSMAGTYIEKEYGKSYILPSIATLSVRKGKGNAQEAHEAIRPTKIKVKALPDSMHGREKRLYGLIRRNTLESCMAPAIYYSLRASVSAPQKHQYFYRTEQVEFPGWKAVGGYIKKNPLYNYMQSLAAGIILDYSKISCKFSLKELKSHYTEAKLVQVLEAKGIGRPSTFSSLISKIQDRLYVQKQDVKGKVLECIDFELVDDTIEETIRKRTFGGERNKLVIQPLGVLVLEFLLKHFDPLFSYEYTKKMEDNLDKIANGEKVWHTLCREGNGCINILSEKIKGEKKEMIRIDDDHVYMIAKYGPVIKREKDGETSFLSVKKDIDMTKLREGGYNLADIIENKTKKGKTLGEYKGHDVLVRDGKYGLYIVHNGKNYSIKGLKKSLEELELAHVVDILSGKKSANPNVLRILREDLSVRRGKWGPYLFYKAEGMKKPRFFKMPKDLDWRSSNLDKIFHVISVEYDI